VIAAGESKNELFVHTLREMLVEEKDHAVLSSILCALHQLEDPQLNSMLTPYFSHSSDSLRIAALDAFKIQDDQGLMKVITFLGDPVPQVNEKAMEKIQNGAFQNPLVLVESLNIPRRKVREGIFQLLEKLNIKDLDVYRFARSQVEKSYFYFAEVEALQKMAESPERNLLIDHLTQERKVKVENILRVLSIQDASGQMRILWRGLTSSDARQRSNSIEALATMVDITLSTILVPLLEDIPAEYRLKVGRKNFPIPEFGENRSILLSHLLKKGEWITSLLTLSLMAKQGTDHVESDLLQDLASSENPYVRQTARQVLSNKEDSDMPDRGDEMDMGMSLSERIFHLKKISIFEGLYVGELAAIGSISQEIVYSAGDVVIKEGESGETMYLIIEGNVTVSKKGKGEKGDSIELDRISTGDYFGEMALFEKAPRSATIRTISPSRFLVLHKREFTEMVLEYPLIALHICKALSGRIRKLHEKFKDSQKQD